MNPRGLFVLLPLLLVALLARAESPKLLPPLIYSPDGETTSVLSICDWPPNAIKDRPPCAPGEVVVGYENSQCYRPTPYRRRPTCAGVVSLAVTLPEATVWSDGVTTATLEAAVRDYQPRDRTHLSCGRVVVVRYWNPLEDGWTTLLIRDFPDRQPPLGQPEPVTRFLRNVRQPLLEAELGAFSWICQ